MSFEADEEILQDFLIEAGEILETMSEQLVALENEPEDMNLLNGIFRGFHTVKGGAGFLALEPLVQICHITENIFDILRNGGRKADADLMDNILKALDIVNEMFDSVRNGESPANASPEFLAKLGTYAVPKSTDTEESTEVETDTYVEVDVAEKPISDDEFDDLLNELSSAKQDQNVPIAAVPSGEITDDEFEKLLDEMHGTGKFSASNETNSSAQAESAPAKANPEVANSTASDEISDDEFEALLDELHGKGSSIAAKPAEPAKPKPPVKASTKAAGSTNDKDSMIDDDEFERLLDELHGAGAAPSTDKSKPSSTVKTSSSTKSASSSAPAKAKTPPQIIENKAPPAKPAAPSSGTKMAASNVKPAGSVANLNAPKKPPVPAAAEATVRVDTKRLDEIMNMVGELVLARNRLKTLGQSTQDADLTKAIATLDIVTADLQGAVMKTRMQPIKKVFGRFPRVVRDLARSLKKEIALEMIGEETDLDKNLVEALADPLVHLVRNSVDHGIETPEERVAGGKLRSGKIVLAAAQEGDHIMLSIEDDGKGMDAELLKQIAIDKGLMDRDHADRLSDAECYNLIFMAGFSTKKEISDISGRGVGMDVVKTKITSLNGSLSIDSTLGKGTKISIKVPLTLAILPTLMVKVKDQTFALPLNSVNEIFNLDLTKTNTVDGQLVIVVREKALPLFFLNEWLTTDRTNKGKGKRLLQGHVVLIQVGTQRVGFVVDSLIGQEEVVIKPLGKSLQGTPGMAGATITSDGGIALIIDIPTLLKHYVG